MNTCNEEIHLNIYILSIKFNPFWPGGQWVTWIIADIFGGGNSGNYVGVMSSDIQILSLNTLRPRQNRRLFADNIFKCVFLNENVWISINISPKFVPKGPINHIPALVQIMASRCPGDKPLSEPMMISWPTHICVTQPQWVNIHWHLHTYTYWI